MKGGILLMKFQHELQNWSSASCIIALLLFWSPPPPPPPSVIENQDDQFDLTEWQELLNYEQRKDDNRFGDSIKGIGDNYIV